MTIAFHHGIHPPTRTVVIIFVLLTNQLKMNEQDPSSLAAAEDETFASFAMDDIDISSHSTLQRSYSTIGIGPVFASPLPLNHPLPHEYFKQSAALEGCQSFLSTELVGAIKSIPQDFIVREIAAEGRIIPGLSEEQMNFIRIADTRPIDASQWQQGASVPPAFKAANGSNTETFASTLLALTDEKPALSMNKILEMELQMTEEGTEASLEAIRKLDEVAEAALTVKDMTSNKVGEIWITPITINNKTLDRTQFHNVFRRLFPLLVAESILRESIGSGSEKEYNIRIAIDNRFHDLVPCLDDPSTDLKALYAFFKRKVDRENILAAVNLVLKRKLPRESRRVIHQTISNQSSKSLCTNTITDYRHSDGSIGVAIAVQWSKNSCRRAVSKNERNQGTADPYPNTLCVIKKTHMEHLTLQQTLQRVVKIRQPDIGLAGIKDMRAVTYQFATLANVSPQRLVKQADALKRQGIEIGTIYKVDWKLSKGMLEGNRFELVVRNVQRVQVDFDSGFVKESFVSADMAHVEAMVDRVRTFGFVNFYGTQRVGEPGLTSAVGVRAFDIGRAMLQQNYTKAIDLLMTGRILCGGLVAEAEDIRAVREVWSNSNGDVNLTYKKLPRNSKMARERIILQGLKRHGNDNPLAAIRCLGYNERTFWVGAYQSYVFNIMATKRLQLHGYNVVSGDLVIEASSGSIHLVTNKDLGCHSIFDVVLPLPGHGVELPKNDVGKLYEQFLAQDGVNFTKEDVPPESTAKGSYRHLIRRATNLSCSRLATDDELHVRVCFDLPAGSYATMFLRELMRTTVVRDAC
ncbi:hypothetical protein MPSEU_000075100 [Mayamaea pseudoterrestris]|nr:hypothetical protein MPSEU_000075100 [Mayamaea pseudoterrestris]